MEKNLPVVYKSQHDPDAVKSSNDCGAASVSQVINFLGGNVTTDQVQEKTGADGGLVTVGQLQKAITALGYTSEFYTNQTIDSLKRMIDKDLPVIALVHYGSLNSTQDKNFKGGHFMPIVGYRADNGIYANDPNFKEDLRSQGDHHNYTYEEFMKAWGDAYLDQNPPFSFIVINRIDQPVIERVVVNSPKSSLRGRSEPKVTDPVDLNVVTGFTNGMELKVISKTTGTAVEGNSNWLLVEHQPANVYVWEGGVKPAKIEKVKKEEPKEDKDKIIAQLRKENKRLLETIRHFNKLTEAFIEVEEAPMEKKAEVTSKWGSLLQLLHLT